MGHFLKGPSSSLRRSNLSSLRYTFATHHVHNDPHLRTAPRHRAAEHEICSRERRTTQTPGHKNSGSRSGYGTQLPLEVSTLLEASPVQDTAQPADSTPSSSATACSHRRSWSGRTCNIHCARETRPFCSRSRAGTSIRRGRFHSKSPLEGRFRSISLTTSQVGAGIQIPPNSGSLLRRWGVLQHLESKAVRPDSINFRRWANGATIGYTDLRQFEANFRAPYYVCHRAHLHEALHARAIELGVEVRLESKVARYCAAESRVELVGGSDVSGDLVVAADGKHGFNLPIDGTLADVCIGIRSGARATILGSLEPQAPSTGFAAYRATVDVEKMKAHPELCWILEKPALNIW
jgi:hypothetical protein